MSMAGGVFLFIAGMTFIFRVSLLSPDTNAWPTAALFVRAVCAVAGLNMAAYGAVIASGYAHAEGGAVLVYAGLCAYGSSHLVNLLMQRRVRRVYST